jgi:MFS family permease
MLAMARHPAPAAPSPAPGTGPRAGWRKVLRANPALARLAIAAGAFGATQVCLNSFIVTFLVRERGLELAQAGWVAALTQGCGLVGRLLWGWVASRVLPSMSLLRALGCVMIVCALTLGTLGASMSMVALLPLAALFGLSASGWNGVFLAEVAERSPPGEIGTTTGAVMVLMMDRPGRGPLLFSTIASLSSLGGACRRVADRALGTLALPGPAPGLTTLTPPGPSMPGAFHCTPSCRQQTYPLPACALRYFYGVPPRTASRRVCWRQRCTRSPSGLTGVQAGVHEAHFHLGDWWRARGASQAAFFQEVAVFRFNVVDLQEHYHLPLKFTAWGFALFRGA